MSGENSSGTSSTVGGAETCQLNALLYNSIFSCFGLFTLFSKVDQMSLFVWVFWVFVVQ